MSLLLSCLDDFSQDFIVEVDLWDSRVSLRFAPAGHLHRWLQLSSVLFLVRRLVSVAVLWFALPAVGNALLLPAVGFALPPAVGLALLPSVGFALLAVLVPFLLTTGSLAGGSVYAFSSGSLCGRLQLRGSFLASLQHHYSALRPS